MNQFQKYKCNIRTFVKILYKDAIWLVTKQYNIKCPN